MTKNSISELVAREMLSVLNSDEHKKLFKKADVQHETFPTDTIVAKRPAVPGAPVVPGAPPAPAPPEPPTAHLLDAPEKNKADDNDAKAKPCTCGCKPCECSMVDDANDAESCEVKEAKAFSVAMESLVTASAALDYAGFVKGAELTLKLAALVSEAKKGKVNLKEDKASKKAKEEKLKAMREKAKAKAKAKSSSGSSSNSSSSSSSSKSTSKK